MTAITKPAARLRRCTRSSHPSNTPIWLLSCRTGVPQSPRQQSDGLVVTRAAARPLKVAVAAGGLGDNAVDITTAAAGVEGATAPTTVTKDHPGGLGKR